MKIPEDRRGRFPIRGSGDLKHPSFPPVAKGLPCRDIVNLTCRPTSAACPIHIDSANEARFVSRKSTDIFRLTREVVLLDQFPCFMRQRAGRRPKC